MHVIVHRIRLHAGVDPAAFEEWVTGVDYATAPRLPSVLSFAVHRVSGDPSAPVHYMEVIGVSSPEAFEKDVDTDAFRALAGGFESMASVVDEVAGDRVGSGYQAT